MKKSLLFLLILSSVSFPSIVRNVFIADSATNKNAIVDSTGSLLVVDTTVNSSINSIIDKLIDIETNQTDRSQFSKITDGTHDLDVQTDGSIEVNVRDESGNAFSLTNPLPVEQAYINDPYLTMAAGEKIALSRLFKIENKYGRATDGVQTTATDIWDRADASATQQIWTAPTTARQHNIASTSANDTSGGTGARIIRIWGLQSWYTAESTEDITMNGTSNVATINSYVIIHRMKVLTHGGDDINVGNITATAVTDGTVTAQITASEGRTLMAIYGIPRGKTAYMTCYLVNVHQGATPATAAEVDFTMYINESPDIDETVSGFINKANLGIRTTGNTSPTRCYKPYLKVEGPAIIKFQGIASAEAVEGVAEFDLIIINDL